MAKKTNQDTPTEKHNIILSFPVLDLYGTVVMNQGTPFSKQVLGNIVQSAPPRKPFVPIQRHPPLWKDLNRAITDVPYRNLSWNEDTITHWRDVLRDATLSPFATEGLIFFKKKDPDTYWHSLHVFALTTCMAMEVITLPEWERQLVSIGPSHDIGKINVPMAILKKKTPLTEKEHQHLRHHAPAGAVLLSHFHGEKDLLSPVVALEHHERLDGSGYPFGIRTVSPLVEMIAMCDVYDALISSRPYRNRPYDLRTALEVITRMTVEGRFSMDTLRVMIALHRHEKPDYRDITLSLETRGTPPEKNVYGLIVSE